jgi:hypothetical protein
MDTKTFLGLKLFYNSNRRKLFKICTLIFRSILASDMVIFIGFVFCLYINGLLASEIQFQPSLSLFYRLIFSIHYPFLR